MKVCFSIDALSPSGAKAWRLLEDQSWRECVYAEALQSEDARILDKKTAEAWLNLKLKKDKRLILTPEKKAGRFDFLMRGIYAHAVLHRLSSPALPDKTQMLACYAQLEVGTAWLVYLNIAGQFKAIDTNQTSIIGNLDIAVRGEIASSGDYIGAKAAADEQMMQNNYRQFLAGWLDHLKSSNMNIFIPDLEKLNNDDDTIAAIQAWQHEQAAT
ncbi:hypothetical protein JYT23_02010 [Mariprofundus ferrooxydans]|nr:hypothetical protein [Mariprofundus ferrooxydans]